ncbi:ABC transporter ATP-binding protein [Psychromarinibacter halotolerans]|uniref:ABC transporter ATP-binding protein n=1 Tax=Psychromarinibacter halotolerans TaxID=1775175 RepID=A0ABV7GW64_9RHOB|nr:sn-glycerol-3-phosphate ABC transporter ATP-binding protein UgpC [Psychromarinibacter halotolerans]MDF0596225.1 sn-glycerol-3-phosphate ABC transporter ATP-binding protein UgpC [Psychromarinibacter halotolerans]
MTANSVEIRGLDLAFGAVEVLKDLTLEIPEGEFLVLLGASGCGKSTLLNCIAGLLDITGGQIFIKDRNVTWAEPSQRGIGMVFQSYALYPQMTVKGNLSFGLKNARIPKAEIEERVARAAGILQIEPLLDRKPAALSGGQRQRVAIGRALVRDVDVFLFDEPLSNLDAKLRADLRVEIKRLHQKLRNTMIYVTHDQIEAMTLADRIAIMRSGAIQQLGSPDEIYNRPRTKYVAEFIGSPAMNFLDGTVTERGFIAADTTIPLDGYGWADGVRQGPAWLGIRPEHVVSGELAAGKSFRQEITVELFEPMGADTLVWTTLAGQPFHFNLDGQHKVATGDRMTIGFDAARGSLFGKDTELRL